MNRTKLRTLHAELPDGSMLYRVIDALLEPERPPTPSEPEPPGYRVRDILEWIIRRHIITQSHGVECAECLCGASESRYIYHASGCRIGWAAEWLSEHEGMETAS